jgi:hypothetical protein
MEINVEKIRLSFSASNDVVFPDFFRKCLTHCDPLSLLTVKFASHIMISVYYMLDNDNSSRWRAITVIGCISNFGMGANYGRRFQRRWRT